MTGARRIDLSDPDGVRWLPQRPAGDGVLVLSGSSGRIEVERARRFADLGCLAESIRWFGGPGQHQGPWEIPIETFLRRIDSLAADCDRIHVVGTSFGSEAALLCGAHDDRIDGVVALSPSDVVWAGYDADGRQTSHWTLDGRALPWVPFDWTAATHETPPRHLPLYRRSRETFADAVPAATIPVDRVDRLVLVAGSDDQVWPSREHADRIVALRTAAGRETVLVTDGEAGHRVLLPGDPVVTTGMTMHRGGTEAADRRLGDRAWAAIGDLLAFGR